MNIRGKILLIDDEINTIKVLSEILKKNGYDVFSAYTAEEGLERISYILPDTIILDYKLPGMNGVEFLDEFNKRGYQIPVIMLTAFGTIEMAVSAMKKGAFNYLTKPVNPDELLTIVGSAVEKHFLLKENILLKSQLKERHSFKNIIGKSPLMQEVFNLIETVSKSNSNILITGDSGTGKELVARAIHYESPRSNGPFITIDCASLPEELLESELFGYEKGAFTGAYEQKIGQIELADNGTLFLDEIGELPLNTQKKFLRFLQEREILRIGGKKRIKVDIRIIAATNKDLEAEVKKGTFREDLFYRLNVVTIHIPPLRERREDIPLLARHFLNKFSSMNNKVITSIDTEVMKAFMEYSWPGNIRELENYIERAVVLCPSDTITMQYLPKVIRELQGTPVYTGELNLLETEKMVILKALEKTNWNQTRAAQILGISRKQLRTKMKNHGILLNNKDMY